MLKNFAPQQKVMKNGILFIWTEKEDIQKMIEIMESVGFAYIENFCLVQLDSDSVYSSSSSTGRSNAPKTKTINDFFSARSTGESSPIEAPPKLGVLDFLKANRSRLSSVEVQKVFTSGPGIHFRKTKKTMLMFRIVRPRFGSFLRALESRASLGALWS